MYYIGNVFVYISLFVTAAFVIGYLLLAKWKSSEAGRFIMSLFAVLAITFGYTSWRTVTPHAALTHFELLVRIMVFGSVAILMCWMMSMFIRRQISTRRGETEDDRADARHDRWHSN